MRTLLALVAVAALAAVTVVVLRGNDAGDARTGSVTLVGDSLNVGIEPYLPLELEGWTIDTDDVVGRATLAGVDALRTLGEGLAPVVVVSLGTNDAAGDVEGFRRLVQEALRLAGPDRCVIWTTIIRDGSPREEQNDVLRAAAGANDNLRLVDWATMVAEEPELLAGDLVHATEDGYVRRAQAIAEAVRACPPRTPPQT